MKIDFINLTPEKARGLLATHNALPEAGFRNRKIKPVKVKHLASDIKSGKWLDNAETLKISKKGYIIDGQHRIMAVILADKAIDVLLATDLQESVFSTIDTGTQRSAGDTFYSMGIKNHTSIASITKRLAGHLMGHTSNSTTDRVRFTNEDAIEIYEANGKLIEEVFHAMSTYYRVGQHIISPANATAVAIALMLAGENSDVVYDFFEELYKGATELKPAISSTAGVNLRNRIITISMKRDTKVSPAKVGDMLFHSFTLYKAGSKAAHYRGADIKVTPPKFKLSGYVE